MKTKILKSSFGLLLLLSNMSCSTMKEIIVVANEAADEKRVTFFPTNKTKCEKPSDPEKIKVYKDTIPNKHYFELGRIEVRMSSHVKDRTEELKKFAAKYCTDALVKIQEQDRKDGKIMVTATLLKYE
jgi:hypothetical protein